jgi:CMP-N-acetylneuraminic acid synthetase
VTQRGAIAFIFARGGSKGIPRKNLRPLAGKPLIAHAIAAAWSAPSIGRVVVSTDDPEIAAAAVAHGAEAPFLRPPELAGDDAPERLAWRHAIAEVRREAGDAAFDLFVSVPTVCPLRTGDDVERCIGRYRRGDADLVLTIAPARANPYYTMVELDADEVPHLVKQPPAALHARQGAPKVFEIVAGCYVASPDFVMASSSVWDGRVRTIELPPERAVDIDTEIDFALAEILMARR